MPDDLVTVATLKNKVNQHFPMVDKTKMRLFSNNVELKDDKKKVTEYGVDYKNYVVELRYPRIYRT